MRGESMNKIKAIIKRPDEPIGHVSWISDTLENLQRTVGGLIEVVPITPDGLVMICNEEGKLRGLEKNFVMGMMCKDVIVGDVIICGTEGEEFADVPIDRKTWATLLEKWGNRTT